MKQREMDASSGRLAVFLSDLLELTGRAERRHWGEVYVRGLLLDGERKSIEPLAQRTPGGDVQALQQFVGQSPWEFRPIRSRLAQRMERELCPAPAWVIDDTGFPKQGTHSVGVARQYSGTLGRTANCQVAVSLHLTTDEASVPLDFELYLPEAWALDRARLEEAGVPEDVVFRTKWQIALGLVDRAIETGLTPGVVTADAGYGNTTDFRVGLEERGLLYMVGAVQTTHAWLSATTRRAPPRRSGKGRPGTAKYEAEPQSLAEIAKGLSPKEFRTVTWRRGTRGPMRSRFAAVRVQPSHMHQHRAPEQSMVWLLIEWPLNEAEPDHYSLSNLPADFGLRRLVRHSKLRWHCEQDYQQTKEELGLDHYEGRTWLGWHHHVTMVQIAHAFLTLERLRSKKNFTVDPPGPEEINPNSPPVLGR